MKKGLILLNNKVEDVEGLATQALLRRAGFQIDSFTLESTKEIKTAYNQKIVVDYLYDEIKDVNYDFLVLPGGGHVFNWLDNINIDNLVKKYYNNNKLIAAICAAPLFLNKVDLLKNRDFTAFPDVVDKIKGNYIKDAKVVNDNNIITARSAGVVYDFVYEIIREFSDEMTLNELKKSIVY